MKTIKTAHLIFDGAIHLDELRAFRSAINLVNEKKDVLLHHHLSDGKLLYRYPLIQFKQIGSKPAIFTLNEGTESLTQIITAKEVTLNIKGKVFPLNVLKIHFEQVNLCFTEGLIPYKITHWIALNEKNYQVYQKSQNLKQQIELLERLLTAHIIAFAEGISWSLDKRIELNITKIQKQSWLTLKRTKLLAFDVHFLANLLLPNYVGLGKSCSVGFGMVECLPKTQKSKKENWNNNLKRRKRKLETYEQ